MLKLIIPGEEHFNEVTNEFTTFGDLVVELEHSLLSLSKWESKYKKPFLSVGEKTSEEVMAYINAMVISPGENLEIISRLEKTHFDLINEYIESSESATTFGSMPERKGRGEIITSELIYYWMVAFTIPFECETWHLNRLFALIRVCNIKNSKPQKLSRSEIAARNAQLNAERLARLGSRG